MRDQVTLTLSSYKGSKNYSIGKFLRFSFLIIVSVIFVVLLSSIALVFWLRSEVHVLEEQHAHLISAHEDFIVKQNHDFQSLSKEKESIYQDTLAEQQALFNILREEQGKVVLLDNALSRVEDLASISNYSKNNDYETRVASLEQTLLEKRYMLRSIPNGYPLKINRTITSGYGIRKHPSTNIKQLHAGIDFRAKPGIKVYATADAVVEFAGRHASGYGNLIILSHSFGFKTMYAHLSRILVKSGQVIQKGHYIGLTGNTGITTGPHLHYEISFIHRKLDPKNFVKWSLENYEQLFKKEGKVSWGSLANLVRKKLNLKEKQLSQAEVISQD